MGVADSLVLRQRLFELLGSGVPLAGAARIVGVPRRTARSWWQRAGMGLPLRMGNRGGLVSAGAGREGGRFLSSEERAVIQAGLSRGASCAEIAAELGRDRSVIWREVARNRDRDGVYRWRLAERAAAVRRKRPKAFKLQQSPRLCARIAEWMDQGWSPKLIADMLARDKGASKTERVSHETVYRALYVQTRGSLRQDLAKQLSTKRTARKPRGNPDRRGKALYEDAFTISERPAEVADRAVPGHWEGDLLMGAGNRSAIGTLVERSTRFVMLLHLPGRHTADEVANAMIRQMRHLPEHLRRSITWDRGVELAEYERIQLALDARVFFCDPHSPWQRGSNENTNRLLRFWFSKGEDLSIYGPGDLARAQDLLNKRPRPTLDYDTPAQRLAKLISSRVATTT